MFPYALAKKKMPGHNELPRNDPFFETSQGNLFFYSQFLEKKRHAVIGLGKTCSFAMVTAAASSFIGKWRRS